MPFFSSRPALLAVQNRVAAVIKPGPAYIAWAQKVAKKDGGMVPTKEEFGRDCLTILLPHYDDPTKAVAWLKAIYAPVVMMQMLNGWTRDFSLWPDPNTMVWEEWFRVEIHSMIFDGGGGALKVDKKDDLGAQWHAWVQKH